MPSDHDKRRRRLPNWLKITLAVFGVLFVLGAIFGHPSQPSIASTPAAVGAPSSSPGTTSVPEPVRYTVTSAVTGDELQLADASGAITVVHVLGIQAPVGPDCFGAETSAWANGFLVGKQVTIQIVSGTTATVTLTDATDYATRALQSGHAKYAADGGSPGYMSTLQAAEDAAHSAARGLWGPPCAGDIDVPSTTTEAPAPPQAPATTPPAPRTNPKTTKHITTEPDAASAYYANCAEARAAGAAPLHIGDPGYRPALDRDHDGTACE